MLYHAMVFLGRDVIGDQKFESGFESESESTNFFLNPNPDSAFQGLNPNPAQNGLNPDSNPNPDSDSHITELHPPYTDLSDCLPIVLNRHQQGVMHVMTNRSPNSCILAFIWGTLKCAYY